MRIALLTLGSRGDVDPFLALALGLREAGFHPWLVVPKNLAPAVRARGLPAFALEIDFEALLKDPETRRRITGGPFTIWRAWRETIRPLIAQSFEELERGARGAEALVFHPKAFVGADIAEATGIPAFLASPLPGLDPTGAFPCPGLFARDKGAWANRLSHQFVRFQAEIMRGIHTRFRKRVLGLKATPRFAMPGRLPGGRLPRLYAYSEHVVPRPGDWPEDAHITGYWQLPPERPWWPDEPLGIFLRDGSTPLYFGLGSMPVADPAALTRQIADAAKLARVRVVLSAGWAGLGAGDLPEHLFTLGEAPHGRLFPRMDAVLHHGGAGTTAAMLRAGRPGMALPVLGDQPWWGERIAQLGAGPRPLPVKKLDTAKLARAFWRLKNRPAYAAKAAAIGEALAREDGVKTAVEIIERRLD